MLYITPACWGIACHLSVDLLGSANLPGVSIFFSGYKLSAQKLAPLAGELELVVVSVIDVCRKKKKVWSFVEKRVRVRVASRRLTPMN